MAFEKYLGAAQMRLNATEPSARLRGNALVLNASLFSALGEPKRVDLFWDREARAIGIVPNEEGKMGVFYSKHARYHSVSICGLRGVFGITADKISVPFTYSDEHQMWVGALPDEEAAA